jgi:small subunit ribosomal protein S1
VAGELNSEAEAAGPQETDLVHGTVARIADGHAIVELGPGSEGRVPLVEFGATEGVPNVKPGDPVEAMVESRKDGVLVLSKEKADKLRLWERVSTAYEKQQPLEGTVVALAKGGFSVDIGVRAFLPAFQADLRQNRDPEELIGEKMQVRITKFNDRTFDIVVSRRALVEKERKSLKRETLPKVKEGAILTGVVKDLMDYGAFIDLGGIDGLLHVSDMSWGRVGKPSDILHVGDEVRVMVVKFDPAKERISLSLKQTQEDPWAQVAAKYAPGTRVAGKVVSLTDYGAFIELQPGVEGLVHVSEMSWKRVKHPSKLVSAGDLVNAVVIDVDAEAKRISLGMKQIETNPWSVLEEQYPIGTVIRGQVRNVTDFGIFVGVQEGIDGLVHVSDISWTQRPKHAGDLYKKGSSVEAVVLNIDVENERMSLGIKQLRPDPWSEMPVKYPIGGKVKGKVTKVTDFGAFVALEPGVEGLVHVSELRDERVDNPRDVVKEGEEVEVKVIDMDVDARKISLSIRAALHEPDDYRDYMKQQQSAGRASFGEIFGDKLRK